MSSKFGNQRNPRHGLESVILRGLITKTRTRNMCCWISFRNCWYCCTFGFSPTSSTYATWAKGGIFLRCPKNKETVQIKKWMVLLMEEIWLTTWDIWNLANVITYQPQVVSRISKHQQYLEKKHNNHWASTNTSKYFTRLKYIEARANIEYRLCS